MRKKPVDGFPDYIIYEDGSLFSLHSMRFLKPFNIGGKKYPYYAYKLCKDGYEKTIQVHRLVATHFIPNPENLSTVNHKDGDTSNNHVDNLEWMTQQDNKASAFINGITIAWWKGSLHSRSTYTDEEVEEICIMFSKGVKPVDLAKSTTKEYQKLFRIYNRDNWKHISDKYNW